MAEGITDTMSLDARMKTITTVTTKICKRINPAKPSEETLYDGGFRSYRNWFRATISMLTTMKFINLENLVKGVAIDPYDIEDWDEYFTQDDREFVYDVVTNSVTQVQLDIIERADRNGILLLVHYFRKWGSPNLPNSIKALSDVLTMKVGKHQDPSTALKKIETIFQEYFADSVDPGSWCCQILFLTSAVGAADLSF